jgi:hypothetical protein
MMVDEALLNALHTLARDVGQMRPPETQFETFNQTQIRVGLMKVIRHLMSVHGLLPVDQIALFAAEIGYTHPPRRPIETAATEPPQTAPDPTGSA